MIDSVTSSGTPVLDLFGPVLLLIGLGVVALLALEALCGLVLCVWLASQARQARPRGVALAALCLAVVVPSFGARSLAAQVARGSVATAQPRPRFTRIFGSDSMQVQMPVLSPDGRWIVFFREMGNETFNLWVVPASGGAPIQLTSGVHADVFPGWFPSGDRIAFTSSRPSAPGERKVFVMTIPFDARTGRSAGPAQQVSLEEARFPTVSPDGRRIVFNAGGRLMVVPSAGGTARTVVQVDGRVLGGGAWSPDGREIYFMARLRGSNDYRLMRVSADSGQAQPLSWSTPWLILSINTTARRALTGSYGSPSGYRVAKVFTFEGRLVATVPLHRGMIPISLTGDGQSVLAQVSDVAAPIRVVPLAGGPSRSITQPRDYDWPNTWSTDATRLAVWTRINGQYALLDLPVEGGPGVEITPPTEAGFEGSLTRDRGHLFYVVVDTATERRSLRVRRLNDGYTREIAPDVVHEHSIVGPGGFPYKGVEALYFGRRGDYLELRSSAPEGASRLLRSFPASFVTDRNGFGVHGERVAWTEDAGDSSALLVAEGPNGAPRRIAVVQGRLEAPPVWSPDGRWIAAGHQPPGATNVRYSVCVVGVSSAGQPSAPPRLVETGLRYGWSLAWLPDGRAVTVAGNGGPRNESDVWLVSLREGDPPVNLTRDDPSEIMEYSLSPDGRYVAYPAMTRRGSSIWRIDW